ncbi:MAG: hypothetical protein LBC98_08160 [Prevotellaceae bacterium]|jgi:hypothetical protein|nr:hypothetical protein [Prevotellaceae bacterium]
MKKRFLVVGVIALVGFGTFLASCKKDKDEKKTSCSCTVYLEGEKVGTETADLSEYDAANCTQLANILEDILAEESDEYSVSCK